MALFRCAQWGACLIRGSGAGSGAAWHGSWFWIRACLPGPRSRPSAEPGFGSGAGPPKWPTFCERCTPSAAVRAGGGVRAHGAAGCAVAAARVQRLRACVRANGQRQNPHDGGAHAAEGDGPQAAEGRGLIPRLLEDVFGQLASGQQQGWSLKIEVYQHLSGAGAA